MAHWGPVRPEQAEGPQDRLPGEREDALAAIRTALLMRAVLQCFNQGRGGDGKPVIKNGCGISSGTVVAGQIGTEDRLEYTVIGEAVRLADRTESFNKSFGTDILITEHTRRLVDDSYLVTEKLPPAAEKETEPFLFAVINLRESRQINLLFEELEQIAKLKQNSKINITIARRFTGTEGPHTLKELRSRLDISEPDSYKALTDEKKFKVHGV